ncbi:MAG: enoyl-CoA hydratase/isomerase family protein [Pseudonocardia sp.]|nr:enoyl-CoA hydratase/isomerase family protein [Pseudonocardia sp.]
MTSQGEAVRQARWISVSELAGGAAGAPLWNARGVIEDPLLVVDLHRPTGREVIEAAVRAAADADRVLVGVGPVHGVPPALLDAVDTTLVAGEPDGPAQVGVPDPGATAAALASAAAANPQASLVLAHRLRTSGQLGVRAALEAESLAYSTLLGGPEFAGWLDRRGPRPGPPACADPVVLARDGDRLRITLNRPQRRNAYGREVRDGLVSALQLAELDPGIGRVLLDGAGPSFCAGGDLDEFGTTPDPVTAHLVRTHGGAAMALHRLAGRTHVRVHGACVGAGIELPAFAGAVTAHPDTTFRLPEVGMGLVPGAGGTVSIPARIGRWRTLHLALGGHPLTADIALAWGLIDAIAAPENL